MSFWNRLFVGKSKSTSVIQAGSQPISTIITTPTPPTSPTAQSLELPHEFDGSMSYREMFQKLPPERLRAICRALPVEQLDLNRPGRPPLAREMGKAISQIFGISIYMATKEVPSEYGDLVFPRLVAQIVKFKGSDLHLELCDLVRDFAIYLSSAGRNRDAVRVLYVLKDSLFWHMFPQGQICLFTNLHNIAIDSNERADFVAALAAAKKIPASQLDPMMEQAIASLQKKIDAL
jgi:hypothetical protein